MHLENDVISSTYKLSWFKLQQIFVTVPGIGHSERELLRGIRGNRESSNWKWDEIAEWSVVGEREREREIGIIWGTDNRGFELSMVSHIRTALVWSFS